MTFPKSQSFLEKLSTGISRKALTYTMRNGHQNGVYVFVVDGEVEVEGSLLSRSDGIGLTGADKVSLKAHTPSKLLLIEVKMQRK